jgi:hypothetical protein
MLPNTSRIAFVVTFPAVSHYTHPQQFHGPTGEGSVAKNILKFIVTGVVVGVGIGWLLSLGSGNYFVTLGVATIGLFVGVILGIVHRNDS